MVGAAYASLNLKWNPFGELTRAEKQALTVPRLDLAPYVERLRRPGYALQILPGGAPGKTTHLLLLREHFAEAPYHCFDDLGSPPLIAHAPLYFLDQLQALPRSRRLSLFRRPASFALISHINHRWEFRLAGISYDLVTLPFYDARRMKQAIDRRLAWARRDAERPLPQISQQTCQRLLQRLGDDVAVYSFLYHLLETLPADATCAEWRRVLADGRKQVALDFRTRCRASVCMSGD